MNKKRMLYMLAVVLCMVSFIALSDAQPIQAAKKKTVKATVKGKTLTISGKGAMPSSLKIKGKKANKIKKVIVKKGITSIPVEAFSDYKNVQEITVPASVKTIGQDAFSCKKLKKLTIPGGFKLKEDYDQEAAYARIAGKVKTVSFNTDFKLETAAYVRAENLMVKKSDSKYKSIDGVVYSKDGRELVRVPFERKELNIAEGCEVFCLQAVIYGNIGSDGDPSGGCVVKKITIPSSVRKVESSKYAKAEGDTLGSHIPGYDYVEKDLKIVVESKQLDSQSFTELIYRLGMSVEDLQKQVPEQISYADKMYVTSDHLLLKYKGENSTVTIPSHIKKVGDYAFFDNQKITKLVLEQGIEEIGKESFCRCSPISGKQNEVLEVQFPDTLQKIGDKAFESNVIQKVVLLPSVKSYGKSVFKSNNIKEIIIPATMKVVPEGIFMSNKIEEIVIPDSVEKISEEAFAYNSVKSLIIGNHVTEIGDRAFCGIKAEKVVLPSSVKKVGVDVFANALIKEKFKGTVEIQGSSKEISDQAFPTASGLLSYTKGAKEKKTSIRISVVMFTYGEIKAEINWSKVKGVAGYEAVLSTNAKFTKNKKKVKLKASQTSKKITIKGNVDEKSNLYVKIRPYTVENGKKVYGRWAAVS